jgi:outer membrane protein OmpA-like peptidoglycan-associated protein
MLAFKKLRISLFILLFAAFFTLPDVVFANAKENKATWEMDIPARAIQWQENNTRAHVIIFRLQRDNDDYQVLPVNVYVNNQYHASLFSEHQAVGLALCPGKTAMTIIPGNKKEGIVGAKDGLELMSPVLEASKTYYYQVAIDSSGKTLGRWVDAAQAVKYTDTLNVQYHTISRVNSQRDCPAGIYNINASALFKVGRSDEQGLLPGASSNLKSLAEKIDTDFNSISKIVVNGYADTMGDVNRNISLSTQRAQTVLAKFISYGLPGDRIISQGLGITNPVVEGCEMKYKTRSEIIHCNQPNRRVEVEVYGVKKVIIKKTVN